MRVLLIDNYDSFTANLEHLLQRAGATTVTTVRNDEIPTWENVDAILVSPGPGRPDNHADFGACAMAYHQNIPLLGVCLGHQGLATAFGANIAAAPQPMHGRIADILHEDTKRPGALLERVAPKFRAVRYHSLVVDENSLPSCLRITARSRDGLIMAMEHISLPLYGVQFHPESICSDYGLVILKNFLLLASSKCEEHPPPPLSRAIPRAEEHSPAKEPRRSLLIFNPTLPCSLGAEAIFTNLFEGEPCSFWLDTADKSRTDSTFSYMGCAGGPHSLLVSQHRGSRIVHERFEGEPNISI